MPVDASLYGSIKGPEPTNLLGMLGQSASVANAINQNKLFQQEFQANQAMGPILQSAIDPKTGQVDWQKAAVGMSMDPRTAYKAPAFISQLIQNNKLQADTISTELQNTQKKWDLIGRASAATLRPGKDVDLGDVINQASLMLATPESGLSKEDITGFLAQLPPEGPALTKAMQSLALRGQEASKTLESVYGSLQNYNQPGGTVVAGASPLFGVNPLAGISPGVSPAQANEHINFTDQQGTPQVGTKQNVLGVNPQAPTVSNPLTGQGGSSQGNPLIPQKIESQPLPPVQASGPKGVQAGLSPYDKGSQENMSKYQGELIDAVKAANTTKAQIAEANKALEDFKPGGGASFRAKLGQFAQAIGAPEATVNGISNGSIKGSQIFDKLMTSGAMQILRQSVGGAGKITNFEYEKFLTSNPNLDTDPGAIKTMLKYFDALANVPIQEQRYLGKYRDEQKKNPAAFPLEKFPESWERVLQKQGFKIDNGQ